MIDIDEHRQRRIRARDHLLFKMENHQYFPYRDKVELDSIIAELAELEAKPGTK